MKLGEAVFFGFVGVLVFVCVVMWLWGGLAGLLWGSGWTELSLSDQLDVLERLPDHVSDPAQAWPREVRADADLPDALPFYASLALTLPVSGAAATLVGLAIYGVRKL